MVEANAGRRSGTTRRRPSGGGEQQRLVAVALDARVVMVTSASPVGSGEEGGAGGASRGRFIEDLLDCLLGVLRALGFPWTARPQRQPRTLPPRGVVPATAHGRSFAAELRQIPGRIAGNGTCAVASLYTMQGKKGVNQDAMIVWEGHDLIIGNLGDSRAVLGTRNEDDQLIAVQLTVDLKPNIPSEAQRIRQRRGRIFALPEEPEVARVWLPKYNSPGLAMARAFGDFCLKEYGLISTPEVSCHHITEKDEFIVLATDGVWDVLSNTEVVSIISRATSRASAARFLVEAANRAWRTRYPTSKIDDCAVVCLFLNTHEVDETSSSAANNLANIVEVSGDNNSTMPQLSTGVSAEVVTAMVKDRDEMSVDTVAKPVTISDLGNDDSGAKQRAMHSHSSI